MKQIHPDEGLPVWMQRLIAGDLIYHLYTSSVALDYGTVVADLSPTEAAWAGYAAITISAGFGTTGIIGHMAYATQADIVFSNTSAIPVAAYGYWVEDGVTGKILQCGQFDGAPVTLIALLGTLNLTPFLGDFSRFIAQ